ncbi:Protein of unknown function [Alteromonadaceae bacterium Bs31]|nr:Protein of unknown function [Alteromonadaceae bacterium Bs31]
MSEDKENLEGAEGSPETRLTLEQALLAPLDSILKAQLHSARSFLNLLLQLGYPHQEEGHSDGQPYKLEFDFVQNNERQRVSVPALSLVPISPLAVDSASFELEMSARRVIKQSQIRESVNNSGSEKKDAKVDRYQRPWFLVDKPVNIEGDIVAKQSGELAKHRETQSAIKIHINVKSIPLPSGLDKLLTSLTNMSTVEPLGPEPGSSNPSPVAPTVVPPNPDAPEQD